MLNQLVLVGRLCKEPEIRESENGKKYSVITLAVPRNYKNEEGIYETDFIDCYLWNSIAENTVEYCKKGDMVGVRGRLETYSYDKDNQKNIGIHIQTDRVTFLSSAKENRNRKEEEQEI